VVIGISPEGARNSERPEFSFETPGVRLASHIKWMYSGGVESDERQENPMDLSPSMVKALKGADETAVTFDQVREGDILSFLTADNGYGGTGDLVKRQGVVTKKTANAILVATRVYVGHLNRADGKTYLEDGKARLLRSAWAPRDVHRVISTAERVQAVDNEQGE
jgi:hypothetical protein